MDYTELITRSGRIVWRNKVLWVLGFFAGLAANGVRNGSNYSSSMEELSPEMMTAIAAGALLFTCIAFVVAVVIWAAGTIARGGLVQSVWDLDKDETATLTVGEAFQPGLESFWRIVGVSIVLYLPLWLFSMVMMVVAFMMVGGTAVFTSAASNPDDMFNVIGSSLGVMILCFIVFLCLLVPVSLFLQLIQAFAVRGTVIRHLGVIESIKHGWEVLRDNVGEILLLGILFVGIGMAVGMAVAMVMLPLAFLSMAPVMGSLFLGEGMGSLAGFWMICAGLGMTIIGALLMSAFTAWRSAAFTLAYKQFTGKHLDVVLPDLEPKFM